MTATASPWIVAVAFGVAASAIDVALASPLARGFGFLLITAFATACIAWALLRRPGIDRRAWSAIGLALVVFDLGKATFAAYWTGGHARPPSVSLGNDLVLIGYPALIYGVARLAHLSATDRRGAREARADAGIVASVALALIWTYVMGPRTSGAMLSELDKFVAYANPLLDCAVLFVLLRGLVFGSARGLHTMLVAAITSMIVADVAYDLMPVIYTNFWENTAVNLGRLVSYVLIGAAALHPAGRAKSDGRGDDALEEALPDARRLPLVALAGFIPPTILVVGTFHASRFNIVIIGLATIASFGLVVMRLRWALARAEGQARSLGQALQLRDGLERELRRQASHDSLTGLANRTLLHGRVEQALARAARQGGRVAVCFCDLDRFKTINDSMGHAVGDALLVAAARRITLDVRPNDTVARLGGDEFAILMEDLDSEADALRVAERIVAALREPLVLPDRELLISVSIGIAIATAETTTEGLLSEADQAMYAAKRAGRDRFALFEPSMHLDLLHEMELSGRFPGALERSEFFLEYQPQFTFAGDRLAGFEALVRWRHPTLGIVRPDRFIGLAEETGHIAQLGLWAIGEACRQTALWSGLIGAPLTIAVNVSALQLKDPALVQSVEEIVANSGLDPAQLVLEITESVLVLDSDDSVRALEELSAIGIRLAIDDFGTGYSSLNHLRRFPVDELKIDRSFIEAIRDEDPEARELVEMIMNIATSFGLETVAEGIETAEQYEVLSELGCDRGQGFLIGRPLDAAAATRYAQTRLAVWNDIAGSHRGVELATIGERGARD